MSSHLRQVESHLKQQSNNSRLTLPPIFPAPPQNQDKNRMYGSDAMERPTVQSRNENGCRQGQRTWRKKDRDANYWRRIYESPSLNKEEKLLTQLKGIDGLPWKEIVVKYNEIMGLDMRQPALQMRLTRLTCRMDSLLAEEASQSTKNSTAPLHHYPQLSSQLLPQLPSPQLSPLFSHHHQQPQQQSLSSQQQQQHLKFLQLPQPPQLSHQIHSQSHYPYHTQLNQSRLPSPPHLAIDPNFPREELFIPPGGCTTLVPMPGSILWPSTTGNTNYLNTLSTTSHLGDMLYYDSQPEPQLVQRQSSSCNHPNSFKYMNSNSIY